MVAVVHHGGAGTITTAARADAPQVVLAQVVDQPYWAGQVAGLRIGTARTTARLRPPAVVPIRLPAAPLEWRYRVSPIWLADTLA